MSISDRMRLSGDEAAALFAPSPVAKAAGEDGIRAASATVGAPAAVKRRGLTAALPAVSGGPLEFPESVRQAAIRHALHQGRADKL